MAAPLLEADKSPLWKRLAWMVGLWVMSVAALAVEGMTMVCVTHEMGFAREVADRVLFFDHGKLLEDAPPAQFFEQPADPRAQSFLRQVL